MDNKVNYINHDLYKLDYYTKTEYDNFCTQIGKYRVQLFESELMPKVIDGVNIEKNTDWMFIITYNNIRWDLYPISNRIKNHNTTKWYNDGIKVFCSLFI